MNPKCHDCGKHHSFRNPCQQIVNYDRVYAVVYYEPASGHFGVDEEATLDYFQHGQYHCISHDRFEPIEPELLEDLKNTVGALLLPKSKKEENK